MDFETQLINFINSDKLYLLFYDLNNETRKKYRDIISKHSLYAKSFLDNQIDAIFEDDLRLQIKRNEIFDKLFVVTKTQLKLTDSDFKYFAKYLNYKLPTYKSPYLQYYVKELNISHLYDSYIEIYNKHGGGFILNLIDTIVNKMKSLSINNILKNTQSDNNNNHNNHNINNKNSYYTYNTSTYIISIDMKSANYTSAKLYDKELVLNTNSWDEFLDLFLPNDGINYDFIKSSKLIRHFIFSKLNNKMINQLMIKTVKQLYNEIYENALNSTNQKSLKLCGNEEIYFITSQNEWQSDLQLLSKYVNTNIFKIGVYLIQPIGKSIARLKINLETNEQQIKCLNSHHYFQALKFISQRPIEIGDLKIMIDDELATLDNPFKFD